MLKEALEAVKRISYEAHKKEVFTSSFLTALMSEQAGQVAEKHMDGGNHAKDIEVDIADVTVVSLACLNWFEKVLQKPLKGL